MVDNVAVTPGTGATVATDDVGGVQYQRVKPNLGADGAATDALGGAGNVSAGVQRITLANDDVAVTAIGALAETAPASDTASSGLNGRLQRIAQRLTSLIALFTSDAAGLLVQQFALSGSRWNYAAASGGITNTTTAVTIAAAAGSGVRNYLTGMQIFADTLGTATEIAIRDGAGGTVLWRGKINTGGSFVGAEIKFTCPLKGTANTLMEFVTLTASGTGSVFVNAQGYTAA